MSKKKLIHFQENLTFPFLFQFRFHELDKVFHLKGSWGEKFFGNANPIILELGCGKGEYTIGLARSYRGRNFIGMDIKGARLWKGCRSVKEENLGNVAFIRSQIDHLEHYFAMGEVSEIWITFPDPQPGKERKRLTSPRFLEKFKNVMKPGGIIHLKTDDRDFYEYTLKIATEYGHETFVSSNDIYNSGTTGDVTGFQTHYENIWLGIGKKICYLQFSLKNS